MIITPPFQLTLDPVLVPDQGHRRSIHAVRAGPLASPPTGTQECHCEIAGTHSDGNDLNLRLPISIIHRDRKSGVTTVPVKVSLPFIGRSFKTLMLVQTGIILSGKQSRLNDTPLAESHAFCPQGHCLRQCSISCNISLASPLK